jgi:hypothetical protein
VNFTPEWGEKLSNKRVSVIVVVNVLEKKVEVLPEFEKVVPGQVCNNNVESFSLYFLNKLLIIFLIYFL